MKYNIFYRFCLKTSSKTKIIIFYQSNEGILKISSLKFSQILSNPLKSSTILSYPALLVKNNHVDVHNLNTLITLSSFILLKTHLL